MIFNRISHSNIGTYTLKNEEHQVNNFETTLSVNDELFQQVRSAENHSGQIIGKGQSDYVDGIKDNVFERVYSWLNNESDNIFTLYGNMGSGKSFFSARLFQKAEEENTLFDSVAFSSQQTYYDTTKLQNMLISVAHQLYERVSVCRRYFSENPLVTDSVFSLAESVLVAPFENVSPEKPVLIIIDGLDEYPRADCEAFLEALARLRARFDPKVKIFFSSRPEPYIITQSVCDSSDCIYHIEKNGEHSYADCESFIDSKCGMTNVFIDKDMKHKLIEKSECSLKYLDCFFNDIGKNHITDMADFIASLPSGLNHYYRDQLSRYFGDDGLKYYQSKIMPLLELLCVAKRPLKMEEAADILGCRVSDISSVISRSGTLLWRSVQNEVRLFQSESIREFLMDDRYCPEKYFIDRENGKKHIIDRIVELIENGDDLENNMYLFKYAVDHIFEQTKLVNADYNLLIQTISCYYNKTSVMTAVAKRLLERSESEIRSFLRHLYAENNGTDELVSDSFCVRIAAAVSDKKELAEKLFAILENPMMGEEFEFLKSYARIRYLRTAKETEEAKTMLQPYLEISEDADIRTVFRHNMYLDEICRIHRAQNKISSEEMTRLHVQAVEEGQHLCKLYERKGGAVYTVLLRNLSVSFNQLAILCDRLEKSASGKDREICSEIIRSVLPSQTVSPTEKGYFLLEAETCHNESLRLSIICQQSDPFSNGRAYDLHLAFSGLGRLYARKDFPKYDTDKALKYFNDSIAPIIGIAEEEKNEEKYIRSVNKSYLDIIKMHISSERFDEAKKCLGDCIGMQDKAVLLHGSFGSEYRRCYGEELMADLIKAEQGIDDAEEYYLSAVRRYEKCGEKFSEESALQAPRNIYSKLRTAYREADNIDKYKEYLLLQTSETEKLCGLYPSFVKYKISKAYVEELAADLVRDESGIGAAEEYYLNVVRSYTNLLSLSDSESVQRGPMAVYYKMSKAFREAGDVEKCKEYLHLQCSEFENLCVKYPDNISYMHLRYYTEELIADLIKDEQGIDAAEEYYLNAVRGYKECIERSNEEQIQRSASHVYYKLKKAFLEADNVGKYKEYLQLEISEYDRLSKLDFSEFLSEIFACLVEELKAELIKTEQGIETAEEQYLKAVQCYKDCGNNSDREDVKRMPSIIYGKLKIAFKKAENKEKYEEYLLLELTELKRLFAMFRSEPLCRDMISCYDNLVVHYYNCKKGFEVLSKMDECMFEIYKAIKLLPDSKQLHKSVCVIFGLWAKSINTESFIPVSIAARAYFMQIDIYLQLCKNSDDKELNEKFNTAINNYWKSVERMEEIFADQLSRDDSKEGILIDYLNQLIREYSCPILAVCIGEDAVKKKLEVFNNVLSLLSSDNPQ